MLDCMGALVTCPPLCGACRKKMPFFLYVYADEGMVVARGASGGLALWVNADSEWQAKSGVLRVYQ